MPNYNPSSARGSSTEAENLRSKGHPNDNKDWATNGMIDSDFKAAYLAAQQLGLHRKWGLFDDYWRSEQNPPENEDDPASVTNVIHPVIESQIADLVDSPVDILVRGVEPSDEEWAKYAQFVCKWIWDTNKMEIKQDQFERHRLKYGTGIWKVYFDPFGNRGLGKIVIDVVGPEKLYFDPKVTSPFEIQKGDFCIQVSDVSLRYLMRRFGKRAKYVRPRKQSSLNTRIHAGESLRDATGSINNSVTLMEYWSKDEEDRLRVVYKADDVILWDSSWTVEKQRKNGKQFSEPSEGFYKHGLYPFVVVPCYLRDGQVWGMGDVELLKPIQDMINDFDDQIRMNARLMGNIQIVVGLASGINPMKWTNKTGLRIPARDPGAWQIVQPAAMPAYIQDRRELGKREAEIISGRTDVVEGRKPAGIKAASAIIALQEAGNRRINHKKLMTQTGLTQVMEIAFEHFREHFTEEVAIRIAGEPGQPDQFAFMSGRTFDEVPKLVPDTSSPMNEVGEHPLTQLLKIEYDEEGNVVLEEPQTKVASFDFNISIGAGLPRNKSFLYQAAIELHREQIMTTEETRHFLKQMIEWPMIDPFNPVGTFSQLRPELGEDGHPLVPPQPMQPTGAPGMTQTPQGMNPNIISALSSMLGGA